MNKKEGGTGDLISFFYTPGVSVCEISRACRFCWSGFDFFFNVLLNNTMLIFVWSVPIVFEMVADSLHLVRFLQA